MRKFRNYITHRGIILRQWYRILHLHMIFLSVWYIFGNQGDGVFCGELGSVVFSGRFGLWWIMYPSEGRFVLLRFYSLVYTCSSGERKLPEKNPPPSPASTADSKVPVPDLVRSTWIRTKSKVADFDRYSVVGLPGSGKILIETIFRQYDNYRESADCWLRIGSVSLLGTELASNHIFV